MRTVRAPCDDTDRIVRETVPPCHLLIPGRVAARVVRERTPPRTEPPGLAGGQPRSYTSPDRREKGSPPRPSRVAAPRSSQSAGTNSSRAPIRPLRDRRVTHAYVYDRASAFPLTPERRGAETVEALEGDSPRESAAALNPMLPAVRRVPRARQSGRVPGRRPSGLPRVSTRVDAPQRIQGVAGRPDRERHRDRRRGDAPAAS